MRPSALALAGMLALATTWCAHAADLTIKNNSLFSVPAEIPGVMNPNFSPMSTSGVRLEKGQVVYFRHRGKREVLLVIDQEKDGDVLLINEIVDRRRAELDEERSKSAPAPQSRSTD